MVNAVTPFLLCLQDMDKLEIYLKYLEDPVTLQDGSKIPAIKKFEHPFLVWGRGTLNFLTEAELRYFHR